MQIKPQSGRRSAPNYGPNLGIFILQRQVTMSRLRPGKIGYFPRDPDAGKAVFQDVFERGGEFADRQHARCRCVVFVIRRVVGLRFGHRPQCTTRASICQRAVDSVAKANAHEIGRPQVSKNALRCETPHARLFIAARRVMLLKQNRSAHIFLKFILTESIQKCFNRVDSLEVSVGYYRYNPQLSRVGFNAVSLD